MERISDAYALGASLPMRSADRNPERKQIKLARLITSLSVRERGSKSGLVEDVGLCRHVAPDAGARVETSRGRRGERDFVSLAMRERGLKQVAENKVDDGQMSLPTRERGSQPFRRAMRCDHAPVGSKADMKNLGSGGGIRTPDTRIMIPPL